MKIKHSKYKNTGILFELLVRQITADTLKGGDSPAIDLLKKYFVKTSLGREYKLYESVLKSKVLSESKANITISTILESSKSFNRTSLKKQKYNLINEINEIDCINNSHIHGITLDTLQLYGIKIDSFVEQFKTDISNCKVIIAHNLQFDYSILMSELYRYNYTETLV